MAANMHTHTHKTEEHCKILETIYKRTITATDYMVTTHSVEGRSHLMPYPESGHITNYQSVSGSGDFTGREQHSNHYAAPPTMGRLQGTNSR